MSPNRETRCSGNILLITCIDDGTVWTVTSSWWYHWLLVSMQIRCGSGATKLTTVNRSGSRVYDGRAEIVGHKCVISLRSNPPRWRSLVNALVVLSSTAEDGELEVRISLANALVVLSATAEDGMIEVRITCPRVEPAEKLMTRDTTVPFQEDVSHHFK
uniref:Uncharacterized protein n=1 Tax=Timema shepardi TaxID=629360 RepID=A0A7R9G066_TIMSH|nr:unnamed protein product [Timema shepardi]